MGKFSPEHVKQHLEENPPQGIRDGSWHTQRRADRENVYGKWAAGDVGQGGPFQRMAQAFVAHPDVHTYLETVHDPSEHFLVPDKDGEVFVNNRGTTGRYTLPIGLGQGQDWRPDHMIGEDFYALARGKRKTMKITSIEEADKQYEVLRLARKKKQVGMRDELPKAFGLRKDQLGAQLEREAVKHAIRTKHGVTDMPAHKLAQYVQMTGAIAHAQGDKLPGAKAWADHINAFKGDILPGEAVRKASEVLTSSGLLGHADRILSQRDTHTPLPPPIGSEHGKAKVSGFVELPQSEMTHDPSAHEVSAAIDQSIPGKIKPATDETVKPASLAPGAKKALVEGLRGERGEDAPVNEDGPLPLADSPEDGPGVRHKDRHRRISGMILQHKPAAIVQALITEFGISPRAARDTFHRWIESRREGLHAAEQRGGAHRLARGKAGERSTQSDPQKRHQIADLTSGVNPMIAGTRLAMHLIQIAKEHAPLKHDDHDPTNRKVYDLQHPEIAAAKTSQNRAPGLPNEEIHALALHALRGTTPKGFNGDVFAQLGDRLEKVGHRHASTYNWGHKRNDNGVRQPGIARSLKEAEFLQNFLAKNVVRREGMSDRQYYAQVLKQFARDAESKTRGYKDQTSHDTFWKRLRAQFDDSPHLTKYDRAKGQANFEKRMTDTLYRLHTLADDRESTADIDAKKDKDWRTQTAMKWANPHMKFSREDLASLAVLAHLNPALKQALTIRGWKFNA